MSSAFIVGALVASVLALGAFALARRRARKREQAKRDIACYFSHIIGCETEKFTRVINGEDPNEVFKSERTGAPTKLGAP